MTDLACTNRQSQSCIKGTLSPKSPQLVNYLSLNRVASLYPTQIRRLNDPGIRSLSIGSVGGFASARAVAQLYNSAVLTGSSSESAASLSGETWAHMCYHASAQQTRGLLTRIGLASNWTIAAAGQIRNSPKVS